jgi:hypothetical protein
MLVGLRCTCDTPSRGGLTYGIVLERHPYSGRPGRPGSGGWERLGIALEQGEMLSRLNTGVSFAN